MGGGLEGFAIPVGLLRMNEMMGQLGGNSSSSSSSGSSSISKMHIPDVTNVDAISHDLFDKLLKLSQYENVKPKSRKNRLQSQDRKSRKIHKNN